MSEESYSVLFEEESSANTSENKIASQTDRPLTILVRLLRLGQSIPPFHPDYKAQLENFHTSLENLRNQPHRPAELHIVREGDRQSSRFVLIGMEPKPVALASGFTTGMKRSEMEPFLQFLRSSEIALLTFEFGCTTRSLSRFVQAVNGLEHLQHARLREKLQFGGIQDIHILHVRDVAHSTSHQSPWMQRVAAARVRSLLMRLPNPSQLESWIRDREGRTYVRRAMFAIGEETSLPATLGVMAGMPAPGPYANLLEVALLTLEAPEVLRIAQELREDESIPMSRDTALALGLHLYKVGEPQAASMLERLVLDGLAQPEDLPLELQRQLRVSSWSAAFSKGPLRFLKRLEETTDSQKLATELNALGHVLRDLVAGGRYSDAEFLVRHVRGFALRHPLGTPLGDAFESFFKKIGALSFQGTIDAFHDGQSAQDKGEILGFLSTVGRQGVPLLLTLLSELETADERGMVCQVLIRMGKEAHPPLLQTLSNGGYPWYVKRNVLFILGSMGLPGGIPVLESALDDSDPRVQREAVTALIRVNGHHSSRRILAACKAYPAIATHATLELIQSGYDSLELRGFLWKGIEASVDAHGEDGPTSEWVNLLSRLFDSHPPTSMDREERTRVLTAFRAHAQDFGPVTGDLALAMERLF